MARVKVKEEVVKKIYIHNDLMNAAYHLKANVLRIHEQNEPGITLHIMGALSILAFTYEAQINFIGFKKVNDWKERVPFKVKSDNIFKALEIKPDFSKRPYSSITKLKKFRDFIAHGKPIELHVVEEIITDSDEEFELRTPLEHEGICTLENLIAIYEDVELVWEELLRASKISHYDSTTTFSGGRTYIEHVD